MPKTPNGTDTKKTNRQLIAASSPPTTRPRKRPPMLDTLLIPSAKPRSLAGNASVRMAPELAAMRAPPMPCTTRKQMRYVAPAPPVIQSMLSSTDATVKITNPRL